MRVSREKKQENAERFIDAFVAEVRERGYDGVSLRDVARARPPISVGWRSKKRR